MGNRIEGPAPSEIDVWLRDGGLVLAASERTARSLRAAFHQARIDEGLTAWPTPGIQDWQSFLRSEWTELHRDNRFILSSLQERELWAGILKSGPQTNAFLEGPRLRLANLSAEAHQLLCAFAPQFLNRHARHGWQRDAEAFSAWLAHFDEICDSTKVLSAAHLPLELAETLKSDASARPPLLLVGFDRLLPTQRLLLDAWRTRSEVREAQLGPEATSVAFHEATDPAAELAACAQWCGKRLASNPGARILVIAHDVAKRRGEMERAFLHHASQGANALGSQSLLEFSLGVPLGHTALARSALVLLKWLTGTIDEHELDWLISTGHATANAEESTQLTAFMRAIRQRNAQRTQWSFADCLRQGSRAYLPAFWVARITQAQRRLNEFARRVQPPLAWAEIVPQLLHLAGWPGGRPLSSLEFQALERWQQTLDESASLGFDGRRITWNEYLDTLERVVNETLFSPQSENAPILIAGPAESAGLAADAVWFLGADENAWPPNGATHPLLPLAVQREATMPHSTAQADWDVAEAATQRLLSAAAEVHFSYARQTAGVGARPSRLIVQFAGQPRPFDADFLPSPLEPPITIPFVDASQVPFPPGNAPGGSSILTSQTKCPFRAFATARLGAQGWDAAEPGLTPLERGQILHAVLHSVWAGPPNGITNYQDLVNRLENLRDFVAEHVHRILPSETPARVRDAMPRRYIDLEEQRLIDLVCEWLRYEAARAPFTVVETEQERAVTIRGLTLNLRVDRVDRLVDGTELVIDYKTGQVDPKSWNLPRPDDVQLPLYAGFALSPGEGEPGGLVFAKIRAGDTCFTGRVAVARQTLIATLRANANLVSKPLRPEDLSDWREKIEELADDFLAGRAAVDPRDYPNTCQNCGLEALCRIQEIRGELGNADTESDEGANE